MVNRRRLQGQDAIGLQVRKVLGKYSIGRHYRVNLGEHGFDVEPNEAQITAELTHRVNTPAQAHAARERSGRHQQAIEQPLETIRQSIDHGVRHGKDAIGVRVGKVLNQYKVGSTMLAYYVQWHMFEAWRPILFADQDQQAKATRDPVAPARRSDAAEQKARAKTLEDGSEVHSFRTLLKLLSSIVKNICRIPTGRPDAPTFEVITTPSPQQNRAYTLLKTITA